MSRLPLVLTALLLPACLGAQPPEVSPRPEARPSAPLARKGDFETWLAAFEPRARAAGISATTWNAARPQMRYLPQVIDLDRRQSEFGARIWDYLDSSVTPARIAQGQAAMRRHAPLLARIEDRFGVPPEVVVAIWGLESSYGANRGTTPTLASLATLAKDGRRAAFFESQLLDALRIVQAGDKAPAQMVGSWAGAFGHVQFMPSSYLTYAVDFTGNGRRDLWVDDPSDALASAANYLMRRGWVRGQPWAIEVSLPAGFDLALTGQVVPVARLVQAGLAPVTGGRLPDGTARLLLPGGARGPALVAYTNYDVMKEYNISDAYVLALGHLSDRLRGAGPLRGAWPRGDRALTLAERTQLQRMLQARGFDTGGVDGRLGPASVAAVQNWQRQNQLPPDGYINADLLERVRRSR
jgi:membrane-bound lytic murein transglycosylase B